MASVQMLVPQATHVLVAVDLLALIVMSLYVSLPTFSKLGILYLLVNNTLCYETRFLYSLSI